MVTFDYGEATTKLIKYWERYHEDYQTLVSRYHELIHKKAERGYTLHSARDGAILRGFPTDIKLLEKTNKRSAVDYIDSLNPGQLTKAICDIEYKIIPECSCFNLLKKRVRYHEHDFKDQQRPKKYVYRVQKISG